MSYRVSTQVYSGPFDLLLQLVTRQKVDIGAISISEVAEQYLAEAERIEALDLDVASDFLLVAATFWTSRLPLWCRRRPRAKPMTTMTSSTKTSRSSARSTATPCARS